jgi:hypothetical protein
MMEAGLPLVQQQGSANARSPAVGFSWFGRAGRTGSCAERATEHDSHHYVERAGGVRRVRAHAGPLQADNRG